jgi:hypothetical protein
MKVSTVVEIQLHTFVTSTLARRGQCRTSAALPGAKSARYPLGGLQSRSGRFGEEINVLPLPDIEPRSLGRPARTD